MAQFKTEETFEFCTQMSMILASGLSVQEGLEIMREDTQNTVMREAYTKFIENIKEFGSFYKAIEEEPYFDSYTRHMIEIGEISGNLDAVMKELAVYYERSYDLKRQLKEALFYPLILLVMMWVVVGVVVWKVLPIFGKVLQNMGSPLSGTAQTMMRFGNIFATVSFIALTLFLIVVLFVVLRSRNGGNAKFLSKFFMTKKLYHNITMARMTYAFSLFMNSGYEMTEALSYLPEIVDDENIKEKLENCRKGMEENHSFEEMLQKESLYQGVYANMIITGFHSGKGDEVMKKVSSLYEKDVDASIGSFLNTIEPMIVIVLSLIVGIILLSVMLPLMSIMTTIG